MKIHLLPLLLNTPKNYQQVANKADQTKKNYDCRVLYINKWMVENEHPLFEDLTDEHVKADHLSKTT